MNGNPKGLSKRYAAVLKKLKNETLRRKATEKTLKEIKSHYTKLLDRSHRAQEHLRHLSHQIMLTQEKERREISRELHDNIAQTLTGVNVHLAVLKNGVTVNNKDFKKKLTSAQRFVEKSVNVVQRFTRKLHPLLLDDLGLIPALNSYIKEFKKKSHIPIYFTSFSGVDQLDGGKRAAFYRVTQSALANVVRHSRASRVDVKIQKLRSSIRMAIIDNGKSFDVERAFCTNKHRRLGLIGMRERIEMVGGSFNIDSSQGKGTTIMVEVPITNGVKG
jgi:signal transduction histidine kinase